MQKMIKGFLLLKMLEYPPNNSAKRKAAVFLTITIPAIK